MTHKLVKFGLATFSVIFGLSMVGISLVAANRVQSKDDSRYSSRRLYLGQEILPDNVLYPLLMVSDRVHLTLAKPSEQTNLQLLYAQRRIDYARVLLDKGETGLALSTLTKSQKYLLDAAHQVVKSSLPRTFKQRISREMMGQHDQLDQLVQEHPELGNHEVDRLQAEVKFLADQIK